MTPPTAPDTRAIRQRLEKITPGEWEAHSGYLVRSCIGDTCVPIVEMRAPYRKRVGLVRSYREECCNLDFIAHAPADIAALLDLQERTATALKSAYEDNTLLSEQIVALHAENSRLRSLAKKGDTP